MPLAFAVQPLPLNIPPARPIPPSGDSSLLSYTIYSSRCSLPFSSLIVISRWVVPVSALVKEPPLKRCIERKTESDGSRVSPAYGGRTRVCILPGVFSIVDSDNHPAVETLKKPSNTTVIAADHRCHRHSVTRERRRERRQETNLKRDRASERSRMKRKRRPRSDVQRLFLRVLTRKDEKYDISSFPIPGGEGGGRLSSGDASTASRTNNDAGM